MLPEAIKIDLAKKFAVELRDPINIVYFGSELAPECRGAKMLLYDLKQVTDKITFTEFNIVLDKEPAAQYKVDKMPVFIPLGKDNKDYGIRFYGIPDGYEFGPFIKCLRQVSQDNCELSDDLKALVDTIKVPLHLHIFSSTACTVSPKMVLIAQKAAIANPNITLDAISINFFPAVAAQFGVTNVPTTFINQEYECNGAIADADFIQQLAAIAQIIELDAQEKAQAETAPKSEAIDKEQHCTQKDGVEKE